MTSLLNILGILQRFVIMNLTVCITLKWFFSEPLKFTHYGNIYKGVDMRGEVGLLSRNVKFDSEEASTSDFYGGHIKVSPYENTFKHLNWKDRN